MKRSRRFTSRAQSGPSMRSGAIRYITEGVNFTEAVKVGRKFGVDVHTITNRAEKKYSMEWREAPDKYDLKSGPWGERPRDWVFSPYRGRRGSPGCGKCEVCLREYIREMWDSVEDGEW